MPPRKLDHIESDLRRHAKRCEALVLDPTNTRQHTRRNIEAVKASLERFGQQKPLVLDRNGRTVKAGNATLVAARELGWEWIAAVKSSLSKFEATAYSIADNRTAELASWRDEVLAGTLAAMREKDPKAIVGFTEAEAEAIIMKPERESDATLLKKLKVTIDDPEAQPEHGEVWKIGKHIMIVADPVTECRLWRGYLTDDTLFCPYPGPFVPLTLKANSGMMILVQPDVFIAGHIIDRFRNVHGKRSCAVAK